jgi:hypothetical protein
LNLGGTSAGLDIHLHPKQAWRAARSRLPRAWAVRKRPSRHSHDAGDDVALLASYPAMHEERREGNEGRILSVQRGVGFQAHRVFGRGNPRSFYIRCRKWTMEVVALMDTLKGKKIMVWTFMGNTRMYKALAANMVTASARSVSFLSRSELPGKSTKAAWRSPICSPTSTAMAAHQMAADRGE